MIRFVALKWIWLGGVTKLFVFAGFVVVGSGFSKREENPKSKVCEPASDDQVSERKHFFKPANRHCSAQKPEGFLTSSKSSCRSKPDQFD